VVVCKAGAPGHPAWFHSLRANASVTVEMGEGSIPAQAVVTTTGGVHGPFFPWGRKHG
jgi:F420H(2)-dependent quinone reductase